MTDSTLRLGQVATVNGDLGRVARPVRLQVRSGGRWVRVARTTTARDGSFTLRDTTSRATDYRVRAPRARIQGRAYRAWTSSTMTTRWEGQLRSGGMLRAGTGIRSAGGRYRLVMQGDGNLVVYDGPTSIWSSGTAGSGGDRVVMQGDGNLVVYDGGTAKWSSSTAPATGARLVMQDDGNLVMYSRGGIALWASRFGKLRNSTDSITETTLGAGKALYSGNGNYRAVMQRGGNFVVYGPSGATWSSGTAGSGGDRVVMQGDGNLVVYDGGTAKWSSGTSGSAVRLVMQNDGNLVAYSRGGLPLWSSGGGKTGYAENVLPRGGALTRGKSLWSRDGRYRAVMQDDGNFVVYGPSGATWSTRTNGTGADRAVMQGDGNLVVYAGGTAKWSSRTDGTGADRVVMQGDGNLVIYAGSAAKWASDTAGGGTPPSSTGGYPDADAVDCSATHGIYSWCKNGSWHHPVRRFAYRNCTDYVAWKKGMTWSEIQHGGSGHAVEWRQGWLDRGRTVSTSPRAGAVAWWGATPSNRFGHVAYVLSVNSDGSAHVGEYNYGGTGTYRERDVRAPYYLY